MSILSFLNNPITLAAAAVLAIGVVIYEIINKQEEGNYSYQDVKRPRPNRRNGSPSSRVSSYEDTANSVRRRKQNGTKAESCSQTSTKTQDKRKLSEKPTRKFDEKDYYQNVFDKIGNDVKNLNKDNDDKKTFQKSIDHFPANNTSLEVEEIKVINIQTSNANQNCVKQSTQNVLSNKENICKQEINPTNVNDPCYSSQNTVADDKQNHTETDNPFCMACEEVLADTVTYPCKHTYLCSNCATIIHRICKKCCLCDSEIKYFQPIEK